MNAYSPDAVWYAARIGAKIALVGDPEQLHPIGASAAFHAVDERVGFADLEEIRR